MNMNEQHCFSVIIEGCTREQADQVFAERIGHDEHYGFKYTIRGRREAWTNEPDEQKRLDDLAARCQGRQG